MNREIPTVQRAIASDLLSLGVNPDSVLMVHSSMRSLGQIPGGPDTVVGGLLQALGPQGTLLMPALSYRSVTPSAPFFDVVSTPSDVGLIAERFRSMPGVLRSVHPTHSVSATGDRAEELTKPHIQDDTPVGPNSPFSILRDVGGRILMIGCGLCPNTSMHGVEELVPPDYLLGPPQRYELRLADGTRLAREYLTHDFAGWRQRYDRIEQLLPIETLRQGKVLRAGCHLIDAEALWSAGEAALRRDPHFFVERIEKPGEGADSRQSSPCPT